MPGGIAACPSGISMVLFKNSAHTMEGVLRNAMHATDSRPIGAKAGDIILIAQTKTTLRPGQKSIRWIMEFVSCEEDVSNESGRIWGKHWRYVIRGKNLRSIEPFDIGTLQESSKNYDAIVTHGPVDPDDEASILRWLAELEAVRLDDRGLTASEFSAGRGLGSDEVISVFDQAYADRPEFKEAVVRQIQRPTALTNALKERYGNRCMICGYPGFNKKAGGVYSEAHHMIELSNLAPRTLQSWNILILCPTCHKKLHYADVRTDFLNPGWRITIEGRELTIT